MYSCKIEENRANIINQWYHEGGILILGYESFRNLVTSSENDSSEYSDTFKMCLTTPGPDLVVCDEGHLLKNNKTSLSIALNLIRCMRRIVLTGTPLQNNLKEYHCMVDYVKPYLLGSNIEFQNRFVNPITNGQFKNSLTNDIDMMKRRSHVLHMLLDGCVQRLDVSVLIPLLPPKKEYVLFIRLTKPQIDLYTVRIFK